MLTEQQHNNTSATPESIWAILREIAEMHKESDERKKKMDESIEASRKESAERKKEFDEWLKKRDESIEASRKESAERKKEMDEWLKKRNESIESSRKESEKRMKKIEESMGSWANNHGFFAEEYFFNSFENGRQNFFGEKFDEIEKNVKGIKKGFKDEYDILLINGKSIGIVEIKFKAHENDVPKVLRKAETFRANYAEYKNHKIYLGLATMAFYPGLEQKCINEGIAVVKQIGDTVVINDEHLKAF